MSTWLTVWLAISLPAVDNDVSCAQVRCPAVSMLPLLTYHVAGKPWVLSVPSIH